MNTETRSTLIGGLSVWEASLGGAGVPGPLRIAALLGSVRRGSLNAALLRAARAVAPVDLIIVPLSIERLPFYDGDLEASGASPAVHSFRAAIAAADGLLIVTPEYNHSLPAVVKNAIDWASRPPSDRLLAGRPVLLMGATAGRSGAKYALGHAAEILGFLGARPFERRLGVPLAGELQDPAGELSDPVLRGQVAELLAEFAGSIRAQRAVSESAIGSQAVA